MHCSPCSWATGPSPNPTRGMVWFKRTSVGCNPDRRKLLQGGLPGRELLRTFFNCRVCNTPIACLGIGCKPYCVNQLKMSNNMLNST
jgi:hypothetical protein